MSLIYFSIAWVTGIFVGNVLLESGLKVSPWYMLLGLIPFPLLFLGIQRKRIILTGICLVIFLGAIGYFQSQLPGVAENGLRFYRGQGAVEVRGRVIGDPEIGDQTTRLHLSAAEIKQDGEWREVSGTALLFVPRYPTLSYGDVLLVQGKLTDLARLGNLDYQRYLALQGISATMSYPDIEVIAEGAGFQPLVWIYSLRSNISQVLTEILPEPQASLAQGIILGIRGNIPSPVRADFVHSGTAHLLAISGLHLSIVAGIMVSLGIWLFGRRGYLYVWLALVTIWLYALLTGLQPPVFRAVIMVSLFLVAELLGRQRSALTALSLAAAVMIGISPQILGTASFQMSFMAMIGLIFVFPPVQSLLRRGVNARLTEDSPLASAANFTVDSFSVSLGALVAVWPLIAYYFGIVSPVALLATLFALPALSGTIVTGALAGIAGLLILPVAQVIAWLSWLSLSYMLLVVQVFAVFPYIEIDEVSPALVWGYYAILLLVIYSARNWRRWDTLISRATGFASGLPRKWVLPPLLIVAGLVVITTITLPDDNLHVSFLDVGQGDAILIQKGNRQILVDGGPSPQAIALELARKMPFWDRTIDLVILTHPGADHVTGLVEVLKRYRVKGVLYPATDYRSVIYDQWCQLLEDKDIKQTTARAGQQINLGQGVVIEVLNPQTARLTGTQSDTDNNGVVLRLRSGKISFLLTADAMWEAEYDLVVRRSNLMSTVLKVGHHGSATSTTVEFLDVVNPRLAVISVGADNAFGHPSRDVVDRLRQRIGQENIYRTDEDGTIEFTTDGERLWVKVGE